MPKRLDHDSECNTGIGAACNCSVGVVDRLRDWSPDWSEHDTRLLIDDAAEFMERLIALFNQRG